MSNTTTPAPSTQPIVGQFGLGLDPDLRDTLVGQVAQLTSTPAAKVSSILSRAIELGLVRG